MSFSQTVSSMIDNNSETQNRGHGKQRYEHFGDLGYGVNNYVVQAISDNIGHCVEIVQPVANDPQRVISAENDATFNRKTYLHQIFILSLRFLAIMKDRVWKLQEWSKGRLNDISKYVEIVKKKGLQNPDKTQRASQIKRSTYARTQDAPDAEGIESYFNNTIIKKPSYSPYDVSPYVKDPYTTSLVPAWHSFDSRIFAPFKHFAKCVYDDCAKKFSDTVRARINEWNPFNEKLFNEQKKSYSPESVNIAAFPEHEMSAAYCAYNMSVARSEEEYSQKLKYMSTTSDQRTVEARKSKLCTIDYNLILLNEMKSNLPSYDIYTDCGVLRNMLYEDEVLAVQAKIKKSIDDALKTQNMSYLFDDWKTDFHKTLFEDVTETIVLQNATTVPPKKSGESNFMYYYRMNTVFLPIQDERFSQVVFYALDRYVYNRAPVDLAASAISAMKNNSVKGLLQSKAEANQAAAAEVAQLAATVVAGAVGAVTGAVQGVQDAATQALSAASMSALQLTALLPIEDLPAMVPFNVQDQLVGFAAQKAQTIFSVGGSPYAGR